MSDRREIKFKYVFQHDETGRICIHIHSLDWIEEDFPLAGMERYNCIGRLQFTGLLDKNGKEIYEGDIVKYPDFYEGDYKERGGIGFIQWDEEHHYVAKWGNDETYICSTWDLAKNYRGEVVGNIYENLKLLNNE